MKSRKRICLLLIVTLVVIFLIVFFKPTGLFDKDKDRVEIISVYHNNRDVTDEIKSDILTDVLMDVRAARTLDGYAPYAQSDVVWEVNLIINQERWCLIFGNERLSFAKGDGLYRKIVNWSDIINSLNSCIE